jgi:hypothetical protein
VTVQAEALRRFVQTVVEAGGSTPTEARSVAHNLVEANLTGHDSHGVGMLPRYVDNLLAGGLQANQTLRVVVDNGSLLTLDGNAGYGQVMGEQAMALGIARARQHGVAVLGLANAHHIGRIGAWAEQCLDAGLVSIHFVNVISGHRRAVWWQRRPLCHQPDVRRHSGGRRRPDRARLRDQPHRHGQGARGPQQGRDAGPGHPDRRPGSAQHRPRRDVP